VEGTKDDDYNFIIWNFGFSGLGEMPEAMVVTDAGRVVWLC
jgi:hypothetical protein